MCECVCVCVCVCPRARTQERVPQWVSAGREEGGRDTPACGACVVCVACVGVACVGQR